MKFVIVPHLRNRFTWELRVPCGAAVASSDMSYGSQQTAIAACLRFRDALQVGVRIDDESDADLLKEVLARSFVPLKRARGRPKKVDRPSL